MKYYYLFGILCFALVEVAGCDEQDKKTEARGNHVDSVAAFILKKAEVNKQIIFPAELLPLERSEIFAKVSGYVKSLKADIGDHVQQGQVLAILEAPEMVANFSQANADVQNNRSKYL